jgi:hypothetical protein
MLQEKFIISKLIKQEFFQLNTKNYNDIFMSKMLEILTEKFSGGPNMKALVCLFNTLLLSSSNNKNDIGLKRPSSEINKWIKKIEKMNVNSSEGWIYIVDIFKQQLILKTPKKPEHINESLREYVIGIYVINSLRYKIPGFFYTFGAFSCSFPNKNSEISDKEICEKNDTVYILTEKIEGETMKNMINYEMKFVDWLSIFMQLLINLEVSQRDLEFTHFDLHTSNVIISKKQVKYD